MAVAIGKLVAAGAKTARIGAGTNLPGKIARKIDPCLLGHLAAQVAGETLAVTGTNGKTTTCGLLHAMLSQAGRRVVHNQLGANMVAGITSAVLMESSWLGRLQADNAVLEIDEASLRGVSAEAPIHHLAVTNLFRDQLDRYGELDTTARFIAEAFPNLKGRVLLNADDPLVAAMGRDLPNARYFGVEFLQYPEAVERLTDFPVPFPREVTACPACGNRLMYTRTFYGHLGHYHCLDCEYERPRTAITASILSVRPEGTELTLATPTEAERIFLPQAGVFNVYNLLAAVALLHEIGLPLSLIQPAVDAYEGVFGRAERRRLKDRNVMVLLIKNPVGATEVLKMVASDPKARLMIALNDNYADGRDVSWIWDAGFEVIPPQQTVVVSGRRAEDMAIRLKYAGVDPAGLSVVSDLEGALSEALQSTAPDETLYVLPTYTALLALRRVLGDL